MKDSLLKISLDTLLMNSSDMIFVKDINHTYRAASLPFARMTGKSAPEEIIGHTDKELFEDINLAKRYEADDKRIIASGRDLLHFVEPITDIDGQPRYGSTSKYLLRDDEGEIIGILGVIKDITMEFLARQHYQQELRYLFDLPQDTYAVCYIDVDDWRIIKQRRQNILNGTLQECNTVEEICKYAIDSMVDKECDAVGFYSSFSPDRLWEIYKSGRSHLSFEYQRRVSDGSTRWVENELHFLMDADSSHLCIMLSAKDIDEMKKEELRVANAAKLDLMTKVLNRETAMECIKNILVQEKDKIHVLYMLDVDNFKGLNDTYGHQAGDQFLVELAAELKKSFRDSDVIGRVGGDEFFVFLRDVKQYNRVEKKAEDILNIVNKCGKEYADIGLSGSVGISIYDEHADNLERLYALADEALYEAKKMGKNQYRFAIKE